MFIALVAWLLAALLVAFAIDSALVALVHRRVRGRFRVTTDTHRMLAFESDAGTFTLRHDLQELRCGQGPDHRVLAFRDIDAIEVTRGSRHALGAELLLGMDISDLWPCYRDSIDWQEIAVIPVVGEKILLFRGGQYRRRKYLYAFYLELQLVCLESLGLATDIEAQGRAVLARIGARMNHPRVVEYWD